MHIGKKDILWNFLATFMRVASGLIVLPLVLRLLSTDEVGLWAVFLSISSLAILLDFGFSNSFTRNITYIFSGVKALKAEGYHTSSRSDNSVDYGLLKSVIVAMKRYYGIIALIFLAVFIVASPFYFTDILETKYSGNNKTEVWIAWYTYGGLVAYQIYTFYYNSLLAGRGFVKKLNQIIIISQASRILSSVVFLLLGFGLLSLVIGQLVSDIVNRILAYKAFYDKTLRELLKDAILTPVNDIMKVMTPNALKIGVTTLGTFFLGKGIIFFAVKNLTLGEIASYSTTKQMIDLIMSLSTIWFSTFYPKLTMHRVNEEMIDVKRMYLKGNLAMFGVYIVCGIGLIVVGPLLLNLIHSKTQLLTSAMILVLLLGALFDSNQNMATSFLLTGNEVPFMKPTIYAGILSLGILLFCLYFTHIGVWAMIIAPFIALSVYAYWKWPLVVIKQLNIKPSDYMTTLVSIVKDFRKK
ncbi:MAG: O-unit flippase-like protein [Paludibacter sp.]